MMPINNREVASMVHHETIAERVVVSIAFAFALACVFMVSGWIR